MDLLKRHIKDRRIPVDVIAEKLSISPATLYRLLRSDGSGFTVEQVERLQDVLSLKDAETADIFFARNSQ